MAIERTGLNFYAPRFEVEIGDKKLSPHLAKSIMDVKIDEKLDEGASFTLTIHDEFDMKSQKFRWLDEPLLDVGQKVAIKIGYSEKLFPMLIGKITSLEPSFFSGELPTITVGGQDLSFDYLKRPSAERTFVDKKYSDIARIIALEAGLLPVIDNGDDHTKSPQKRKNNNETYYAFLERLKKVRFEQPFRD